MADNRTMAQMLQAPIEGYEDAIVVPPINANNFELKHTLINLVQSNQFTRRQDPHNHLRFFNKVTSTFRHPEVPNTTVKLLLFPFSLEGEARIWLDKEPPRSILTWEDFDALDSAAGGNFLDKIPRECLSIIERKSKVRYPRIRVTDVRANANAPLLPSSHSNSFDLQQIAATLEDKSRKYALPADQTIAIISVHSLEEEMIFRNTILNPKGEAKSITTRSGMSYKEPPIPPTGVNQQEPVEVTTDTEPQNSDDIHPPTVQVEVQVDKPGEQPSVVIPKANLPYPSRLQKKNFERRMTFSQLSLWKSSEIYTLNSVLPTHLYICFSSLQCLRSF
nr:reverse transcriptase domain-containing protein [Tanacetum cinerariifolium]